MTYCIRTVYADSGRFKSLERNANERPRNHTMIMQTAYSSCVRTDHEMCLGLRWLWVEHVNFILMLVELISVVSFENYQLCKLFMQIWLITS